MIHAISDIKSVEQKKFFNKIFGFVSVFGIEGIIWISALLYLAFFIHPYETHFTICPLSNLGFEHCPGCGLGNSIALLFHGKISQSFEAHILGIPALLIILHRIVSLVKFNRKKRLNHNK